MLFQDAAMKYSDPDTGSQVSIRDFASLFPIYHFDVSHHVDSLKKAEANITIYWELEQAFARAYNMFWLVLSERFVRLHGLNGKMDIIVYIININYKTKIFPNVYILNLSCTCRKCQTLVTKY